MASGNQQLAQSLGTGPFRELVYGLEHQPLGVDYKVLWIPLPKRHKGKECQWKVLERQSSPFLAPGTDFVEDSFSMDWGWGFRRMIQAGYIYCALYFYYYYTAPPQTVRRSILEVGGPWFKGYC